MQRSMEIEVDTKDAAALSDAELAEMADICTDGPAGFDLGLISKQAQEWVLVTRAWRKGELVGFAFCTLERIGGTPSLLVGLASVSPAEDCEKVLCGLLGDQFRRALLAFPDEDVLLGARLGDSGAFRAFAGLTEIVPRIDHKPTGEERAWGRRLAKRFGADGRIDDRRFVISGTGSASPVLDYAPPSDPGGESALDCFFEAIDRNRGDCLVAFGWAMAEDLADGKLPPLS